MNGTIEDLDLCFIKNRADFLSHENGVARVDINQQKEELLATESDHDIGIAYALVDQESVSFRTRSPTSCPY